VSLIAPTIAMPFPNLELAPTIPAIFPKAFVIAICFFCCANISAAAC